MAARLLLRQGGRTGNWDYCPRAVLQMTDDNPENAAQVGLRTEKIVDLLRIRCASTPIGQRLGDEEGLALQLGVGKRTLRSALRELEREAIIHVLTGRGGGVFVVAQPIDRASQLLSDHLALTGLPLREVKATAMLFFRIGAIQACKIRSERQLASLERSVWFLRNRTINNRHLDIDAWCSMRSAIVEGAGNPALSFFYDGFQSAYRDVLVAELRIGNMADSEGRALLRLEEELIAAICDANVEKVGYLIRSIINLERRLLGMSISENRVSGTLLPQGLYVRQATVYKTGGKLAHQTLRALHADIRRRELRSGERLGILTELSRKFGVGDDVMREALLLGCQQNLLDIKRGRHGGVFVRDPDHRVIRSEIADRMTKFCTRDEIAFVAGALHKSIVKPQIKKILLDILSRCLSPA